MERQRHIKDIPHPMYDTIDNALSAVDGYKASHDLQHRSLAVFINSLVVHPEYSQEQQSS